MTDHDCPHAVTLRNLLDACERGRPLADITDRLRVEVGRLGTFDPLVGEGTTQPDPRVEALRVAAQEMLDAEDALTANVDAMADEAFITRFYGAKVALRRVLRASGEGTAPQPDTEGVLSPEDFEHYRKAAGLVISEPIPPLSEDMRRAAYDQLIAIQLSHEKLRSLAERGTAPQVPAEAEHGVIDWRSALRSQQGSTHDEDGNPLPQVPAEVLWEGETVAIPHGSVKVSAIPGPWSIPPGTRVRVVAADDELTEGP